MIPVKVAIVCIEGPLLSVSLTGTMMVAPARGVGSDRNSRATRWRLSILPLGWTTKADFESAIRLAPPAERM